jgi:hypothetical protein
MNSRGRGRGYGGGRSSSHAPPRIIMNSRGGSGRGRGRGDGDGDGGGRVSHPSLQTQNLGLRVSMINNRNGSNEAGGLALHRRSDVSVLSSLSTGGRGREQGIGGASSSSSGAAGRGGGGGDRVQGRGLGDGGRGGRVGGRGRGEGVGMGRAAGSQKTSLASKATAQSQKQTIDPKNWAQSASKAFLRQELLKEDSIYWTMTPKDAYSSMPALFSPFKYENFVTNFRNLKKSIKGEIEAISFDDGAVKKEKEAFPPDGVDRRGNERFHIHPAKQLLIDDIKNGAGMTYFNRPRDLRETKDEYMEFDPKYFRKAFNRQKQREKEEVGWQHRRNLRGARNNLQRVAEGV